MDFAPEALEMAEMANPIPSIAAARVLSGDRIVAFLPLGMRWIRFT